jgi:hypothetical protein
LEIPVLPTKIIHIFFSYSVIANKVETTLYLIKKQTFKLLIENKLLDFPNLVRSGRMYISAISELRNEKVAPSIPTPPEKGRPQNPAPFWKIGDGTWKGNLSYIALGPPL